MEKVLYVVINLEGSLVLIKSERDKIQFPTYLLCGECSSEKGMEKYYRLIEIPNKYSINLEKVDFYSINIITLIPISKL